MKKIFSLILLVISSVSMFVACNSNNSNNSVEPTIYTITFVQEGYDNIVKQVEEGKTLTDIPMPIEKAGYDANWNISDFYNVQENITVSVVYTAKEYLITYTYNSLLDNAYTVILEKTSQSVLYDDNFTLPIASASNESVVLVFKGWKNVDTGAIFEEGVYKIVGNITLEAVFEAPDSEWS